MSSKARHLLRFNPKLFEKIMLMRKEFDRLTLKLADSFKNEDQKTVEKLVNEAVKNSRRRKIE